MRIKFVFILVLIVTLFSCRKEEITVPIDNDGSMVYLIWNKSDSLDTKENLLVSLKWYFSTLGASLPSGSLENGITYKNSNQLQFHYQKLGFGTEAIRAFEELENQLIMTEEFASTGGIDLGRWVALTLNNSDHYYRIVGMPDKYSSFVQEQKFASFQGAIHPSTISFGYRKILFPDETNTNMAFVSEEYDQDFTQGNHQAKEFEVIDLMSNGQLRFGIYQNGNLINGAEPSFSGAGKPTKCMWCHESKFLPNFSSSKSFNGYLSSGQFNDTIEHYNSSLARYRSKLESMFDYSKTDEHTQMEILYIRFFEPSAQRLSHEWNISVDEVQERLKGIATHVHGEFPELGELYFRHEIDEYAPFTSLIAPTEMRETENNQINYLE